MDKFEREIIIILMAFGLSFLGTLLFSIILNIIIDINNETMMILKIVMIFGLFNMTYLMLRAMDKNENKDNN